ncbi:MAG: ATP-binding protein [Polyangiaceae bacterium]|nr:ATP-binding protein [Polyangiaceae bacterium]
MSYAGRDRPASESAAHPDGEFFNRERELASLEQIHGRDGAQLVAIYGRRRIGKTSLLMHWIETEPKMRAAYFVAHRTTSAALLAKFSQALQPMLNTADPAFSFSSWEAALHELARLARTERLVVVIDELPYLLECEPSFATILQAVWDGDLRRSKVRLLLTGSHYHMMQDTLASPRGPLFGRTTADLLVDEIGLREMALFLPAYSPEQLVETYSVIGGVPRYLEAWSDRRPVLANIRDAILSPVSMFRNEPTFLIQDEIAEPRTYMAILEAIGGGMKRPVDIAKAAGVNLAHVGKYLHTLELLRFVRRIVSIEAPTRAGARVSQYEIRDPYLRFHFTFVLPNLRLLEQGRLDRLLGIIRDGFDAYVGKAGYEEICRRHVAALSDQGELPFDALDVGRIWDRRVEIDVVALDRRSRSALVGECRWRRGKVGVEVLDDLKSRAAQLQKLRDYKLHYILFSRAGFTTALEERARKERVWLVQGVPAGAKASG